MIPRGRTTDLVREFGRPDPDPFRAELRSEVGPWTLFLRGVTG